MRLCFALVLALLPIMAAAERFIATGAVSYYRGQTVMGSLSKNAEIDGDLDDSGRWIVFAKGGRNYYVDASRFTSVKSIADGIQVKIDKLDLEIEELSALIAHGEAINRAANGSSRAFRGTTQSGESISGTMGGAPVFMYDEGSIFKARKKLSTLKGKRQELIRKLPSEE